MEHQEEHDNANSPIDWMLLSFHNDLGEEHLECFSEMEHPTVNLILQSNPLGDILFFSTYQFSSYTDNNSADKESPLTTSFVTKATCYQPLYYFSAAPLRAPPFCA